MEDKQKIKKKMELHPNEIFVIECWRKKYRFGEITIKIHEGIPQVLEKIRIKEYPPKEHGK